MLSQQQELLLLEVLAASILRANYFWAGRVDWMDDAMSRPMRVGPGCASVAVTAGLCRLLQAVLTPATRLAKNVNACSRRRFAFGADGVELGNQPFAARMLARSVGLLEAVLARGNRNAAANADSSVDQPTCEVALARTREDDRKVPKEWYAWFFCGERKVLFKQWKDFGRRRG